MKKLPDKTRVLVIAAHPDDELLGCGGTVALHVNNGDIVTNLIVCESESLRYGKDGVDQKNHIKNAANILGINETICLGFTDQTLDICKQVDLITPLEKVIKKVNPRIIYCQYGGDVNTDHLALFQAVLVATRPTEKHISAVYAFDTASSTEWGYPRSFVPDIWVDISDTLTKKIQAMNCYESEICDYPHPRSIKGLQNRAFAWGNQVCLEACEVFMTVRRIFRNGETPV